MDKFHPETDGIDHINVYSKGKTLLGKLLSNFAFTPFYCPEFGDFTCVEGFWYWWMTGNEKFRNTLGFESKQMGKLCNKIQEHPTEEELLIVYKAKLKYHPSIQEMLNQNNLLLTHYYVYNNKVFVPKEWLWTAKLWNKLKQ